VFFPYRDDNPTERTAVVTIFFIVLNVLIWVFFQRMGFNEAAMANALCNWGLIPGEITGRSIGHAVPITRRFMCVVDPESSWFTLISMQFLHGSWMHLVGNMLFLWIFGNNVEDAMGRVRFIVFYLLCGILAGVAQIVSDPSSPIPAVGASGAVSGVLGAYLILFPRARVWMVVWIFIFIRQVALPAWIYLLVWIGLQVASGMADMQARAAGHPGGGVAFWAHVGGFLAGVVMVHAFVDSSYMRRHRVREHIMRMRGL